MIPKTYIGLAATANDAEQIPDQGLTEGFVATKQFRAFMDCRVIVRLDPTTREPNYVEIRQQILNPGFTPPFDQWKDPVSKTLFFIPSMSDPNYYPGELSPLSAISLPPAAQSTNYPGMQMNFPANEKVLVRGFIKYRAGLHTDGVGINEIGAAYHVPWVWNEFALTYGMGSFYLYGRASIFPTTWWYFNGTLVEPQPEVSDQSFPMKDSINIDITRLKIYPVLSSGAPRSLPQPPAAQDSGHQYTVPGGNEWRRKLPVNVNAK